MVKRKITKTNEIKKLSLEVTAKPIGNSCYVLVPKSLLGKRLKVSIEVIE
jgi:putative transposon-encoded protein